MIQDVVSFSDSLCSGKCVRCRIILPLYYFPVSVCHSRSAGAAPVFAVTHRCLGAARPPRCRQLGAALCPSPRPKPEPRHPFPGDLFLLTLGSHERVTLTPSGSSD